MKNGIEEEIPSLEELLMTPVNSAMQYLMPTDLDSLFDKGLFIEEADRSLFVSRIIAKKIEDALENMHDCVLDLDLLKHIVSSVILDFCDLLDVKLTSEELELANGIVSTWLVSTWYSELIIS